MKTLTPILAALLVSTAHAGVKIETVTRDIKTQAASGAPHTILVQDGKVRFNAGTEGAMILKGGVMYMIDDKRKTYREMDKATMKATLEKASAAMKQMQEQMAQMPPEQRKQMEQMMKMPGMAGGKTPVFSAKDTGKSETSEGRKCRVWHLLKDGAVAEELCVVPFASLPGKEDFEKTFKELAEAFAGMAAAMPGAAESTKMRNSINGYPVRTRVYMDGKPLGVETVLKSWTEESVPAASFDVPKGYKKEAMPTMPGMGG